MPYRVEYRPVKGGKNWAKIKSDTGEIASRHRSKAKALASIRVYYANNLLILSRFSELLLNRPLLNQSPLSRRDPTRTVMLRRGLEAEIRKRFQWLMTQLREFLIEADALALRERVPLTILQVEPRQFEFQTDERKLEGFNRWLRDRIAEGVLSDPGGVGKFIESAYRRGQLNAFLASKRGDLAEELGIGDVSQEQFLRQAFGQPETLSKVRFLATRAFEQLRGISSQMATDMNRILAEGLVQGQNPLQIARRMSQQIIKLSRTRARLIARTECLAGSTLIDSAACQKLFRRFYEGNVVEVGIANGSRFTVTPNHPMLTIRGWVAAGELDYSDKLFCRSAGDSGRCSGVPDIDGKPTSIEEIFDSVSAIGRMEWKFASRPDFHGDGLECEVNILSPYRMLTFGSPTFLEKKLIEEVLPGSDLGAFLFCPFCSRLLPINEDLCFCRRTNDTEFFQPPSYADRVDFIGVRDSIARLSRSVARYDLLDATFQHLVQLIGGPSASPGKDLGFGIGSGYSHPLDEFSYERKISGLGSGNLWAAHAREIEFDEVTFKKLRKFSGHVYNLQTATGYFTIGNGVYTGNTIAAHAEGQLDSFKNLGVEELGIMAEWVTAGDDRVCPRCEALEGKIFTVEEARGMIPLHPACRCTWVPAEPEGRRRR